MLEKWKIFLILIFISTVSSVAIYSDLSPIVSQANDLRAIRVKLHDVFYTQDLIRELQKERGLNVIYHSKNTQEIKVLLKKQMSVVNQLLSDKPKNTDIEINSYKRKLSSARKADFAQETIFSLYTKIIMQLLHKNEMLLHQSGNAEIKNSLIIYKKLSSIQEYYGELRARVGSVLEQGYASKKDLALIFRMKILIDYDTNALKLFSGLENVYVYQSIVDKGYITQVNSLINTLLKGSIKNIHLNSVEWFRLATSNIDILNQLTFTYFQKITQNNESLCHYTRYKLIAHILFWFISILIALFVLYILYKTTERMLQKNKLLEEYKKAIDASTIVSKTDASGIITYANQAFCDISGFTIQELLGKPHNIVRHSNVQKETFKKLWVTIKSGKSWSGEFENKKKNGESYWVQATISPIYDDKGELVEYIAIRNDVTDLYKLNAQIQSTQKELIFRISEAVESRSKETGNHIRRVSHYSALLGKLYGLDQQECEALTISSTLHDIGKIAIPDAILLKPGKLSDAEFTEMQSHAYKGYVILKDSTLPLLKDAAEIAYEHHEYFNGKGYPRGLQGKEISINARIVAIADVFDALISKRVYKEAWELERVISLFESEKGKQFDPELTRLFLDNIDDFMQIQEKYEDS